jgi:hypothetical protein
VTDDRSQVFWFRPAGIAEIDFVVLLVKFVTLFLYESVKLLDGWSFFGVRAYVHYLR